MKPEAALGLVIVGGVIVYLGEPIVENQVKKYLGSDREATYDELACAVALDYGFDPNLLRAIIRTESNWKPDAVSADGQDIGIAQIRIGTARLFRTEWKNLPDAEIKAKLMDPLTNLDLAGRVLAELIAHGLGSSPAVFHAWNIGETKYRKGTRSPFIARYTVAFNDYSGVA